MNNAPKVTPREQEVLHLIAHEHSTKEIASKLYVSYETVNSHRKNLLRKMDVKNTAGLVRVAFERGLMKVSFVFMLIMLLGENSFAQLIIWDGSSSTDWHTASNWDLNRLPTISDDVTIPSGITNYPTVSDSAFSNYVRVNGAAHLTIADNGILTIDGGSYGLNLHNAGDLGKITIETGGILDINNVTNNGIRLDGGKLINAGTIEINNSGSWGINCQIDYDATPNIDASLQNHGTIEINNSTDLGIRAAGVPILNDSCALIISDKSITDVENYGTVLIESITLTTSVDNHTSGIVHYFGIGSVSFVNNYGVYNTDAALRIWDGCAQNSSWELPNNWSRNVTPSTNDKIHIQDRGRNPVVDTELDTLTGYLFTIDSTAEISIADGGRLPLQHALHNYGKFNVLSGGEFATANNFYNLGSGVFTNHGNSDVLLFSNEGSLLNHGILSTTDLYNYSNFQNMPCGISDIINGLYASDSIVKNEGLIRMHSDNFQQSNGDYQEYGYQVDTNDVLPDYPQLLYSFDRMINEEFFYSDPNNNGISLCAGDTSDLSNQSYHGAFPLRCDYVYYGTNTWQNNEVELYEDCVDNNLFEFSGNTWFQFYGTGDSIQITGNIVENTSEIHFYEDSQNGLICLSGFYDFGLSDTINFLTEFGKIYYLRLGTYQSEPEITEFEIRLNCFCTDEPLVYQTPNDFYNGNNITVSSDSTVVGTNILFQGAEITYSGADGVILNPHFEIKPGALFEAKTDGCP